MVNTAECKRLNVIYNGNQQIYTDGRVSIELEMDKLDSICRLCLFGNGNYHMNQLTSEEKHLYNTYISNVSYDLNELPNKICDKCLHLIKIFVEFKMSAVEVEDALLDFIKQHDEPVIEMKEERNDIHIIDNVELEYDELSIARNISVCKCEENEETELVLIPEDPVNYQCETCGNCYETKQDLCDHSCILISTISPSIELNREPVVKKRKTILISNFQQKYRCKSCGVYYKTKELMNKHECTSNDLSLVDSVDNEDSRVFVSPDKPLYRCQECGTCYKSQRGLTRHSFVHSGIRLSKTEENLSNIEDNLDLSQSFMNTEYLPRNYECDTCGNCYETKRGLSRHYFVHSGISKENTASHPFTNNQGEANYQCPICEKCYQSKRSLDRHCLVHTGMPHWCDICKKGFSGPKLLNDHMNIHSGEYPYSCSMCTKIFSTSDSLRSHKVYHHSGNRRILKGRRIQLEF